MTTSTVLSTLTAPPALDELCINTLRFLAVDMVQKANSGHPGLPLGSATMAYALWDRLRAGLIHDVFSARPGVEDDDMNVFCLGGKVIGSALAWELVETFLAAHFSDAARHRRRVEKVQSLEQQS